MRRRIAAKLDNVVPVAVDEGSHLDEHPALQIQLRTALIKQARAPTSAAVNANGVHGDAQ